MKSWFVWTFAPLAWVVGIMALVFTGGKSAMPSELVVTFIAGALFFTSFIIIDRMRTIVRAVPETLGAD